MSLKRIVIVGGGSAGLSVAARLANADQAVEIVLVEPSDVHYYQPLWTLVGGGICDREQSMRKEADLIPLGVDWKKDFVQSFDPDQNALTLRGGETLSYDVLVVAAGIQLNWGEVKGLKENLGKNGICSNYSYESVNSTWENIKNFKGGKAIFTFPATSIKCAGAPQKIMWLAEHWFERQGIRDKCDVIYGSATAGIFGVKKYGDALGKLAKERNIQTNFKHNLVELRADSKEAVFKKLEGGDEVVMNYDMIHVTPPQSAPDFIKSSSLANADGWVDVDMYTTQHTRHPNVFSLGDCSSLPCSKTGAAVRKQAPVTTENILHFLAGEELTASYDGYASCPLVTGYGRLILAEFGYGGKVMETFPFNQAQERYSMYAMKAYGLPPMYWHGMLKGRV